MSTIALVAVLAASICGCSRGGRTAELLPDIIGSWTAGDAAEFVGDDLNTYINGGAEIFNEHGFDRVTVREYRRAEERVSVELYSMAGDAFGIYSYARSQSGEPVDIGAGGTLSDYYLHFWSEQQLVAVTSHGGSADPRQAVLEIARGIGEGLPNVGEIPELIGLLPPQGCSAVSEAYFVGPLGLQSAAPSLTSLFGGFSEGVAADCTTVSGESAKMVVLRWRGSDELAGALDELPDRAASLASAPVESPAEDRVMIPIGDDRFILGAHSGALLRLAIVSGEQMDIDRVFPSDHWEVEDE
jgi:hypothetical protein